MQLINYEPHEVWELFQKDKTYLNTTLKPIAENPEFDVVIYLTSEDRGTSKYPNIVVCMEDSEIYSEVAVSEADCEYTVKKIYQEYLDEANLINRLIDENDAETDDGDEELDHLVEIEARETELYDAMEELLNTYLNEKLDNIVGYAEADDIRDDVIDHLCEYLYAEHGLSVYRPMVLEDEDGEEFFEEFPYDCMILDE